MFKLIHLPKKKNEGTIYSTFKCPHCGYALEFFAQDDNTFVLSCPTPFSCGKTPYFMTLTSKEIATIINHQGKNHFALKIKK